MDLGKLKGNFTANRLRQAVFGLFLKYSRVLVLIFAISVLGYCVYIWYAEIFSSEWDEARKQEYIKSKEDAVVLNKAGFESILEESRARREISQEALKEMSDIFRLEK